MGASWEIDKTGAISIAERGPQEGAAWTVIELAEKDDEVAMAVTLDDDKLNINMSCHHVDNEAGDRAFHAALEVNLDLREARRLSAFLCYLLNVKDT